MESRSFCYTTEGETFCELNLRAAPTNTKKVTKFGLYKFARTNQNNFPPAFAGNKIKMPCLKSYMTSSISNCYKRKW